MGNKTKPKKIHAGFELKVKRAEADKLERVGPLFTNRDQAHAYQQRYHASAKGFAILGVRLSTRKVDMTFVDKKAAA